MTLSKNFLCLSFLCCVFLSPSSHGASKFPAFLPERTSVKTPAKKSAMDHIRDFSAINFSNLDQADQNAKHTRFMSLLMTGAKYEVNENAVTPITPAPYTIRKTGPSTQEYMDILKSLFRAVSKAAPGHHDSLRLIINTVKSDADERIKRQTRAVMILYSKIWDAYFHGPKNNNPNLDSGLDLLKNLGVTDVEETHRQAYDNRFGVNFQDFIGSLITPKEALTAAEPSRAPLATKNSAPKTTISPPTEVPIPTLPLPPLSQEEVETRLNAQHWNKHEEIDSFASRLKKYVEGTKSLKPIDLTAYTTSKDYRKRTEGRYGALGLSYDDFLTLVHYDKIKNPEQPKIPEDVIQKRLRIHTILGPAQKEMEAFYNDPKTTQKQREMIDIIDSKITYMVCIHPEKNFMPLFDYTLKLSGAQKIISFKNESDYSRVFIKRLQTYIDALLGCGIDDPLINAAKNALHYRKEILDTVRNFINAYVKKQIVYDLFQRVTNGESSQNQKNITLHNLLDYNNTETEGLQLKITEEDIRHLETYTKMRETMGLHNYVLLPHRENYSSSTNIISWDKVIRTRAAYQKLFNALRVNFFDVKKQMTGRQMEVIRRIKTPPGFETSFFDPVYGGQGFKYVFRKEACLKAIKEAFPMPTYHDDKRAQEALTAQKALQDFAHAYWGIYQPTLDVTF